MRCLPLLGLCTSGLLAACDSDKDDGDGVPPTETSRTDNGGLDTDTDAVDTTDPYPNVNTTGGAETCVVLFGGNDRIRGDDDAFPLLDEGRTLQAWIRTGYLGEQTAASYGRPSPDQGYLLGTDDGYVVIRAGSGSEEVVGRVFVADDAWHHVAASYDGRLAVITVDGQLDEAGELTVQTLEGDVVAGNTPTGDLTTPWIGWLDDVRLFHGPRLPDEIAADLDGLMVPTEDLLLHWDFEIDANSTGPGLVVPDGSGNGVEGTTGGEEGRPLFLPCR